MKIDPNRLEFSETAAHAIFPPRDYWDQDMRPALEALKPWLLQRLEANGDTWAELEGKPRIELRIQEFAGGYEIVLRPVTIYTVAPDHLDGFGTKTIVRKVEIYPENLEWQTWRYQNAGYPTWTQEQYEANKEPPCG